MNPLSKFIAVGLFVACCAAAPASNGNSSNSDRPTQARITALDIAAAKRNHYIDPFTLREVASDTMFRKVIAERMAKKIKPPKFHKPPRSPNKPDEDDDDHDNGNHNGQGNHDDDDHGHGKPTGNGNGNNGNGNGNSGHGNEKDNKNNSRVPDRRYR